MSGRRTCREFLGPILAPGLLLVALTRGTAGGALDDYPTDLRGQSGDEGYRILNLSSGIGFQRRGSAVYIVDPSIHRADSESYVPDPPWEDPATSVRVTGLAAHSDLRGLLQPTPHDGLRSAFLVEEVMGDFFRLVAARAVPRGGLMDLLRSPPSPSDAVVAVGVRFRVRCEVEDPDLPPREFLECRLQLRMLRVAFTRIEGEDPALESLSNLAACELLFEDEAAGSVPLDRFALRPEDALRAAMVDALRHGLAASFSTNPRLRDVSRAVPGDLCGSSLSELPNEEVDAWPAQ